MRTLGLLDRLDAAVIQANSATRSEEVGELGGARAVDDPGAHWRAGLARAVARLSDAELILLEDRDAPPDLAHGIGEDLQVAVVPAGDLPQLSPERLSDAQALVVTRADEIGPREQDAIAALHERCPGVTIFRVSLSAADTGLGDWARWIEGEVRRRRT
jgi:hypothetical protein